jgi:prepilin signal peptidase PulO-like enzyme (type II secretory pathway)
MLAAWLALSLPVRYALLAFLGACVGGFVNWGITALAWFQPRPVSPWSSGKALGLHRNLLDYIPIFGWLLLRRESTTFGAGHWIRPFLIELIWAALLPILYRYELAGQLLPTLLNSPTPGSLLHAQFVSHMLLLAIMCVATFIDLDEQTIPDSITIPGALLGLGLVGWMPEAFTHVVFAPLNGPLVLEPLWFHTAPRAAEPSWVREPFGLLLGIACFVLWCYALVPKTCTLRRGWWKGLLYLHASMLRGHAWWQMGILAIVGSGCIYWRWSVGELGWSALFTSLVGLACGGGLIWLVRVAGFLALRKEAMGFGDVTLMCVLGAFLGWQATLMVFFLAPMAALLIALAQTLLTGRRDIAFGPYLCLGAVFLITNWRWLWPQQGAPVFELGWIVPGLLAAGLLLMTGLLMLWRIVENAWQTKAT